MTGQDPLREMKKDLAEQIVRSLQLPKEFIEIIVKDIKLCKNRAHGDLSYNFHDLHRAIKCFIEENNLGEEISEKT